MEHLIVKLLIDFVEREKPFEQFDIESSTRVEQWKRLKELYDFFKSNPYDKLKYDELTEKLVEIVRLRGIMWT